MFTLCTWVFCLHVCMWIRRCSCELPWGCWELNSALCKNKCSELPSHLSGFQCCPQLSLWSILTKVCTVVIWCLLCFETESYSVPQAGLKVTAILLSQSLTPCAQLSTWGRGKPWKWQHFHERILFNRTKDSLTITFCSSRSVAWWHFSILQCLRKSRRYPKRVSTPYPTYVSTATSIGVSSKASLNGLLYSPPSAVTWWIWESN